jgi:four helix bundle protein
MSGTFKDLESWQCAFELALQVYSATRNFPREETYGLSAQMRRAAVSVVSNIAEGKGRSSDKELLQFLATSKGSLFELETQVELAAQLSYLRPSQSGDLISKVNETGRLLSGLMRVFRGHPNHKALV